MWPVKKFTVLFSLLGIGDHMIFARRTLSGPVSSSAIIAASNRSAASLLISSSSAIESRSIVNNHTHGKAGATAALPISAYPNSKYAEGYNTTKTNHGINSGTCAIKELYCSSKGNDGIVGQANTTTTDDVCLLWDATCSGNKTSAIDKFFDPTFQRDLLSNRCFVLAGSVDLGNASNCEKDNPPGRMSEFQEMKDWMRSKQCASVAEGWAAIYRSDFDPSSEESIEIDPDQYHFVDSAPDPSCCGACSTNVQNVDVYYWPEPDVNTSCLSIIGDSIRPVDYGATTTVWSFGTVTSTNIYWGCYAKPSTYSNTLQGVMVTDTAAIRTAMIRTIGSLRVKVSLSDPWSPSPCTEIDQGSNRSAEIRDRHATMYARDHTLIIPSTITNKDSLPVTTMISGNFTFTSPSVYAKFHGIDATDQCGGTFLSSTMIAFAPGELATIAGPLGDADGDGPSSLITKSFNFNDLPCPPQSVMEENWYKPQPGEPYRPLIALPTYDPPSALTVATALAPPNLPVPSPTSNPGAGQTVGAEGSVPVPASIATLDQPRVTGALASPSQKGPSYQPRPNDPAAQESPSSQPRPEAVGPYSDPDEGNDRQQGSSPKQDNNPNQVNNPDQGNDPKQDSEISGEFGQEADPKPNSDPYQVDPVPQNSPNQINDANSFKGFTGGQTKTINNQVLQPLSHGISIAGTTLTPGASPITVSGTLIHLGSSALVIGTSTVPLASNDPNLITTTIAGHVITAAPGAIAVSGNTLTPGASPVTVSGTPIKLGSSALIVGTSTVPLAPESPMIITVAGQAITAAPNSVAIAGKTLSSGAPGTTIDGTVLSLDTSGHFVVGSKTIPLGSTVPETITSNIAGQVITAAPNGIAVAGTTLRPGAPGVTLSGTLISLDTANQLIVGLKTISLSSASPNPITTTIGGQVITAAPNGLAIAGTTLAPGVSGVTVGGTLVSLNTAGQLVVGSKTTTLPSGDTGLGSLIMGGLGAVSSEAADPIITTIDGQVITAEPTALVMSGTTLTPGAHGFTIDGTVISLNTAAQLVVGSKTIPLEKSAGSSGETAGLGGLIMGAFGSGGPFGPFNTNSPAQGNSSSGAVNGTSTSVKAFEGNAVSLKGQYSWKEMAASVIAMYVLSYMC